MQRRTSQTFQRLRKLSDSLIQAIVPSSKQGDGDSFMQLSRKDSRQGLSQTPSYTSLSLSGHGHHRRTNRRISKEDIRYPLIPQGSSLDLSTGSISTTGDPRKPPRPSRPREEDLPYGPMGSLPKALAPPYVPPPPAIGQSSRSRATGQQSVPFPEYGRSRGREEKPVRRGEVTREKPLPEPPMEERRHAQRRQPEPAKAAFFNPFMAPSSAAAQQSSAQPRAVDPSAPVARSRQAGVRRISSSGDVHLPPQHARYRHGQRNENEPLRDSSNRHPDLRAVRSTPLRSQDNRTQPSAPMPLPAYPASPSPLATHIVKPRPKNVPRDVSPENPQRLPTPRRSTEELRGYGQRAPVAPVQVRPPHPPASSVAARAQAALRVQQIEPPRSVQMTATPEHLRALSMKAQVVRPPRDHDRDRDRQREREARAHDRDRHREPDKERARRPHRAAHTRAIEVEYYGMADAFQQEITLALMEPERANPLPLDWKAYVATGPDYGVRPLVTKKSRLNAGAAPGPERPVGAARK
ncbi:hypothetical protein FKP32DRAFT_293186 [Trametes sanguinea]|nr:hypothetical protein FKP32DRAFT_293186 [Trametes sanguinea]